MAQDFTTTELIAEIKRKITAPESQDLWSDSDFCKSMTDVQRSEVVPYMISVMNGYFETEYELQTVSGTRDYLLPPRAVGLKLASVVARDSSNSNDFIPLNQVSQVQMDQGYAISGDLSYCIRGNYLRLPPNYTSNLTLIIRYYRRPSELVLVSQAGKVLSKSGNVLTLDNAPSSWASGTLLDIHRGSEPFQSILDDVSISTISGFDVTIADASEVSVGDWVCFAGQCVIPQIPLDLFPVLTSYAGLQCLEALSSPEEVAIARGNYEKLRENLFSMTTPRVVDSPKPIAPNAAFRFRRNRLGF